MGNLIKNTKMNFVDLDTTLDFLGDIEDAIKRFREALEEGRDDSVVESTTQEKKRKSSSTSPGSAKKTKLSEKEKQRKEDFMDYMRYLFYKDYDITDEAVKESCLRKFPDMAIGVNDCKNRRGDIRVQRHKERVMQKYDESNLDEKDDEKATEDEEDDQEENKSLTDIQKAEIENEQYMKMKQEEEKKKAQEAEKQKKIAELKKQLASLETEKLLDQVDFPQLMRKSISNKKVQVLHLGVVRRPYSSYVGPSANTSRYPELFQALKNLTKSIDPDFEWTSVAINKNVLCK